MEIVDSLILGSRSPRRAQLLAALGIRFSTLLPPSSEPNIKGTPHAIAYHKAFYKYQSLVKKLTPPFLLLTADTLVSLENQILQKPKNKEEAQNILKQLSNQTHQVTTTLILGNGEKEPITQTTTSLVTFHKLSNSLINDYLETKEPWDKAGAYAIQGLGSLFVKKIEGSYTNVVGLPIESLLKMLENFYHKKIWEIWKKIAL